MGFNSPSEALACSGTLDMLLFMPLIVLSSQSDLDSCMP